MSKLTRRQRNKIPQLHRQGLDDLEIASQLRVDVRDVVGFRKKKGLFNTDEISNNRRTRRLLIIGVSASVLTVAIGGGIYLSSSLPIVRQYIDKDIIAERQATLDKLVAGDPGPHLGRVSYNHRQISNSSGDNPYGITIADADYFGKHNPAYIILFSNAFEDETREIMGKTLLIPGKVKINVAFKHEWIHARNQFEGIHLDNGLFIDSTNYNSVKPDFRQFLEEAITQMDTYKFFRDQGQDKTAILFVAGKTGGWFNLEYPKLLAAGNFSKFEIQLLEPVVMRYNSLASEFNVLWQQYSASK